MALTYAFDDAPSTDKMLLIRAESHLQEAARQGGNRVVHAADSAA